MFRLAKLSVHHRRFLHVVFQSADEESLGSTLGNGDFHQPRIVPHFLDRHCAGPLMRDFGRYC